MEKLNGMKKIMWTHDKPNDTHHYEQLGCSNPFNIFTPHCQLIVKKTSPGWHKQRFKIWLWGPAKRSGSRNWTNWRVKDKRITALRNIQHGTYAKNKILSTHWNAAVNYFWLQKRLPTMYPSLYLHIPKLRNGKKVEERNLHKLQTLSDPLPWEFAVLPTAAPALNTEQIKKTVCIIWQKGRDTYWHCRNWC